MTETSQEKGKLIGTVVLGFTEAEAGCYLDPDSEQLQQWAHFDPFNNSAQCQRVLSRLSFRHDVRTCIEFIRDVDKPAFSGVATCKTLDLEYKGLGITSTRALMRAVHSLCGSKKFASRAKARNRGDSA